MYAQTNSPYPNRIQLVLAPFNGPFIQNGPLGAFDPRRDLQVYVDGSLQPVQTFSFDAGNNRYLLFMASAINLQGVIQIIHHVPSPPFESETSQQLPGFAIIASFVQQGDSSLPPQAQLYAVPFTTVSLTVAPGQPVNLLWDTLNVAFVRITGNNGVDPSFDTGLVSTAGAGIYVASHGFTQSIVLVLQAYDQTRTAIPGLTSAVTIYLPFTGFLTTTVLAASPMVGYLTQPIALTATVSVTSPVPTPPSAPTGTVQFYDGVTPIGAPQPVAGGVATYSTSALTAGTHNLSAQYIASAPFFNSVSNIVIESVVVFQTMTVLVVT